MPGVSALPMVLAQCNAVISLVDKTFYDRAWCCVETIMVQALKKSYNIHLWYEHVPIYPDASENSAGQKWVLREGPRDLEIVMADKKLTFPEDRPKVLFLERQSKFLG